jgi:hypothetical protein
VPAISVYKQQLKNRNPGLHQGCQMVYFKTKSPVLVHFGRSLNGKVWYFLRPFGILCSHLLYFMAVWYIFRAFTTLSAFWYFESRKIWQPWSTWEIGPCSVRVRSYSLPCADREYLEVVAWLHACVDVGVCLPVRSKHDVSWKKPSQQMVFSTLKPALIMWRD